MGAQGTTPKSTAGWDSVEVPGVPREDAGRPSEKEKRLIFEILSVSSVRKVWTSDVVRPTLDTRPFYPISILSRYNPDCLYLVLLT